MQSRQSWTPHSYPIQSPPPPPPPAVEVALPAESATDVPKTDSAGVPLNPTSSEDSDSEEGQYEVPPEMPAGDLPRIPRNIRALKDGLSPGLEGRNIIVCLDGTGDKFDADNSNIVSFVRCLKKSDPRQITYYQPGIGTYNGGGLSNGIGAAFDMAIGSGLGVHIRDAYKFLMQNYLENDRICLLGFSRGAYTARCLGGMLHKVGLLPAHNVDQIPFAYQYYKDDSENGWKMSLDFKRTFCINVSVHFIGVFDSVASVGFIPRRLPLSSTPTNKATYFRHAMALDEHRAKFKVCHFQTKDLIDADGGWHTRAESNGHTKDKAIKKHTHHKASKDPVTNDLFTRMKEAAEKSKQTDVLEVWFTGCHADVGGGAVKNEERHKLSQIPLRWMIRQCFLCNTGIIFKTHCLAEEGLDVHTLYPTYRHLDKPTTTPAPEFMEKFETGSLPPLLHRSSVLEPVDKKQPQGLHIVKLQDEKTRKAPVHWTPEQVEDYFDAMSPLHDMLVDAKGWYILEAWPIKVRIQPKNSDEWIKKVRMNMARFRAVQDPEPNLHWTVERRMQEQEYKIRTRLDRRSNWKVVV